MMDLAYPILLATAMTIIPMVIVYTTMALAEKVGLFDIRRRND